MNIKPALAGLGLFPLSGLGFYAAAGHLLLPAVGVGVVVGGIAAAAYALAFPHDSNLASYKADARKRVRRVLDTIAQMSKESSRVENVKAREDIQSACQRVLELLDSVQQRDPGSVASMAATLNVTVTGASTVLDQYLKIQDEPDLYSDAQHLLVAGAAGFSDFNNFVIKTFRTLNDVQTVDYRATLNSLKPLEIKI